MAFAVKQVCPLCGLDDDVVFEPDESGAPVFVCRAGGDLHPYEWRVPTLDPTAVLSPRTGVGEELGVYDDLPTVLIPGEPFVEYGVVEHRYARQYPKPYRELLERYGHTAIEPKRYTASAFLGRALGTLFHEGTLACRYAVPATGRWSYNSDISAWALPGRGAEENDRVVSWVEFAEQEGFDPETWPALDVLKGGS